MTQRGQVLDRLQRRRRAPPTQEPARSARHKAANRDGTRLALYDIHLTYIPSPYIPYMTPLKKLQVGGFNRDSVPLLSIERPNLGMMPSNTMHFRSFSPTDWMGMTFFQ